MTEPITLPLVGEKHLIGRKYKIRNVSSPFKTSWLLLSRESLKSNIFFSFSKLYCSQDPNTSGDKYLELLPVLSSYIC